jgi:zinc protease
MNYRLGGSFASQLTQQLREGYTYGIGSSFDGSTLKDLLPFIVFVLMLPMNQ